MPTWEDFHLPEHLCDEATVHRQIVRDVTGMPKTSVSDRNPRAVHRAFSGLSGSAASIIYLRRKNYRCRPVLRQFVASEFRGAFWD